MRIGIISDTHVRNINDGFINLLDTYLSDVDIIIHAGDYINKDVITFLKTYGSFLGVWGNVDDQDVKNLVNEKEVITLEGYKIGIFHGHGKNGNTPERAYEKFKEDQVDIIIFGHSHQPLAQTKNKTLILNPGSLTNKRRERWFSYIILELHSDSITVQYKFLS